MVAPIIRTATLPDELKFIDKFREESAAADQDHTCAFRYCHKPTKVSHHGPPVLRYQDSTF